MLCFLSPGNNGGGNETNAAANRVVTPGELSMPAEIYYWRKIFFFWVVLMQKDEAQHEILQKPH